MAISKRKRWDPPRVPGFIPKREYIGRRHVGWSMIPRRLVPRAVGECTIAGRTYPIHEITITMSGSAAEWILRGYSR